MNKLFAINIYYKNGYHLGTITAWTLEKIEKKRKQLEKNGLHFTLIENNDLHMIYHAR